MKDKNVFITEQDAQSCAAKGQIHFRRKYLPRKSKFILSLPHNYDFFTLLFTRCIRGGCPAVCNGIVKEDAGVQTLAPSRTRPLNQRQVVSFMRIQFQDSGSN